MKPTKPFLFTLALIAIAGLTVILTPARVRAAESADPFPLSTKLTPAMIDFFGLAPAFERASIPALLACQAKPACGASDSMQVRFVDGAGEEEPVYDGSSSSAIEQVRRQVSAAGDGVTETRTLRRRYSQDADNRLVMSGIDSVVRRVTGGPGREASTVVRVNRYADVRYRMNDPMFIWPMTGLVVLELSNVKGTDASTPVRTASHAAVSFDGTRYAHVLTSGALTHRVNLQSRLLETTVPDR